MARITFNTYREAYTFLFAARGLGFDATHSGKAVTVSGVPCDDERWSRLSDLVI